RLQSDEIIEEPMNDGKKKLLYLFFPDFLCLDYVEKQREIEEPASELSLMQDQHWKPEDLPVSISSFQQVPLEAKRLKRALCANSWVGEWRKDNMKMPAWLRPHPFAGMLYGVDTIPLHKN